MKPPKRSYEMKKRAATQAQTRERIVASTAELHATIGPAQTTISAVADRAGVPRSTVYRHFEDEAALIVACATHWQMTNQPPALEPWVTISDPEQRLQTALLDIYGYYRSAGPMLANVLRDEAAVPVLTEVLGPFRGYFAAAHEILMAGRQTRAAIQRRTAAAVGHALAYTSWQSLTQHNQLTDTEAATLMTQLAAAVDLNNTR
jgi:AcrR family transcriptional regulator